jgi:hypothetical protein
MKEQDEIWQKIYYPVEVDGVQRPNPVIDLHIQVARLNSYDDVVDFFEQLSKKFQGNLNGVDLENFVERVDQYCDTKFGENTEIKTLKKRGDIVHKVSTTSDNEQISVDGSFSEEDEAKEIIREYLKRQRDAYRSKQPGILGTMAIAAILNTPKPSEPNIFEQRLVYYKELDKKLEIYRGASKQLLKTIALEFNLEPKFEGTRTIKFHLVR